jgi:mannose-1-phosphate guanylyltransferase
MPKQFLPLIYHHSTYQQALMRVADAELFAPPVVMTASDFRFFPRDQAEELGIEARVVLSRSDAIRVRPLPQPPCWRGNGIHRRSC